MTNNLPRKGKKRDNAMILMTVLAMLVVFNTMHQLTLSVASRFFESNRHIPAHRQVFAETAGKIRVRR